jgi:signal transduction histidine kinase
MIRILLILLLPTLLLSKEDILNAKFLKADSCFKKLKFKEFRNLELELSNSDLNIDKKFYLKELLVEVEFGERKIGKAFETLKYIQEGLYIDSSKFKDINFARSNYFISLGNLFFNVRNYSNAIPAYIEAFKYSKNQSQIESTAINLILSYYYQNDFTTHFKYNKYLKDSISVNFLNIVKSSRLNDSISFNKCYNSKYLDTSKLEFINTLKIRFEKKPKETFLKLYKLEKDETQRDIILYEAFESNNLDSTLKDLFLITVAKNENLIRYEYASFINGYLQKNKTANNLYADNKIKDINLFYLRIGILILILFFILISFIAYYVNKNLRIQRNLNQELQNKEDMLQNTLEIKDQMLHIVSHDILLPLATSKFNINIAQMKIKELEITNDSFLRIWERLDATIKNTYNIANNLLTYVKSFGNEIKVMKVPISVNEIVLHYKDVLSVEHRDKNLKFNLVLEEVILKTDKELFASIIRNIFKNAIKFSPINETITIKLTNYSLSISNKGVTIPIELLNEIQSDEFKKVTSSLGTMNEQGNGYGLKIIKSVSKLLNLQFLIESNEIETKVSIIF